MATRPPVDALGCQSTAEHARGGGTRAIQLLTVLGWIGAIAAIANTVVRAEYFGTSRVIEVYFVATGLYLAVVQLTETGQLFEMFVPVYQRIRHAEGIEAARGAFAAFLNWLLGISGSIAVLVALAAIPLVSLRVPGFDRESIQLAASVFRAVVPLLVVQVFCVACATYLNIERVFGRTESWGIVGRVLAVITLAVLAVPLGLWALVAAFYVEALSRALGLAWTMRRVGYLHRLTMRHPGLHLREVTLSAGAGFTNVLAQQVYQFLFIGALSMLPQGGIAIYRYSWDLYSKFAPLVLRPVNVVFFSEISALVARSVESARRVVEQALRRNWLMAACATAAAVAAAQPLVAALWGSEAFGEHRLTQASMVFTWLVLLLGFEAYENVARRTAVALGIANAVYVATGATAVIAGVVAHVLITTFGLPGAVAGFWVFALLRIGAYVSLVNRGWPHLLAAPILAGLKWSFAGGAAVALALWVQRSGLVPQTPSRLTLGLVAAALGTGAGLTTLLGAATLGEPTARAFVRHMVRWRRQSRAEP